MYTNMYLDLERRPPVQVMPFSKSKCPTKRITPQPHTWKKKHSMRYLQYKTYMYMYV